MVTVKDLSERLSKLVELAKIGKQRACVEIVAKSGYSVGLPTVMKALAGGNTQPATRAVIVAALKKVARNHKVVLA